MNRRLITHQHLAMKLGIFIIGIATGFEASPRQLAIQSTLFLVFMLLETHLYSKLLFALRKLLIFLAAYWVFATIFALDFLYALSFSARILYLMLVMVGVWGAVDKKLILQQSKVFLRLPAGRKVMRYLIGTYYFLKSYLVAYKAIPNQSDLHSILQAAVEAGQLVHAQSDAIALSVEADLNCAPTTDHLRSAANLWAAVFLFALVMVNSL